MTSMFPGQGSGQPKGDPSRPGPVDYNRAGRKQAGNKQSEVDTAGAGGFRHDWHVR